MAIQYKSDHIHLRSPDPVAAARFYVEALGAREVTRLDNNGALRIVLDLGGLSVFVEQVPATTHRAPEPPYVGIEHIGLGVNDMDAAVADLRTRGVHFVVEPKEARPGVRIAFLEGPDKVRIELIERRPA
ncbi:VOC family protein [Roseomonas sp. NAR14]|uniref:VOC family protein n=1 Tax=Roseomonas acroporae TaxID=2937791 RepID=A0A9X1Y5Q5_9PROT|nr:VOC family protein [Roseomonas acroporae]MCK8783933.1 VOC family protein [Roseomonas acroporae]